MADANARYNILDGLPGVIDPSMFRTQLRQPNALYDGGPVWENNHAAPVQAQQRPSDWAVRSGIAEAISPTMGAYGMGNALGTTSNALMQQDWAGAAEAGLPLAAMAVMPAGPKGAKAPRAVDSLGYYSGALEAARGLPQAKGTVEQMAAMLQKGGAKAGEIEATGLNMLLEGRPTVTRDEIVGHLEQNRLGLNENVYGPKVLPTQQEAMGNQRMDLYMQWQEGKLDTETFQRMDRDIESKQFPREPQPKTKWSAHSLDPSNPTYRETVLHLPEMATQRAEKLKAARLAIEEEARSTGFTDYRALSALLDAERNGGSADTIFRSGHFSEPNIVGHMMTSMNRHEGKPVFTLDQIQSDWGQKLRDGGVRDEAKIAGIRKQVEEAEQTVSRLHDALKSDSNLASKIDKNGFARNTADLSDPSIRSFSDELKKAYGDIPRLKAELATAEASTPGHPLVNTTDQWTNTTLRRAIQQAIEAKAQGIAVPTGDTVLSYNPGNTAGMHGFYGSAEQRGIVPKNLGNILQKLDPSTQGQYIQQLETPGQGMTGSGFTYFPLSEAAIAKAREGMPLFGMGAAALSSTPWLDAPQQSPNALYGDQ